MNFQSKLPLKEKMQFTLAQNTSEQIKQKVDNYKGMYGALLLNSLLMSGYEQKFIQNQTHIFSLDQYILDQVISSIKSWNVSWYNVKPMRKYALKLFKITVQQTKANQQHNHQREDHQQKVVNHQPKQTNERQRIKERYQKVIKNIAHIDFLNLNMLQLNGCNLHSIENLSWLNCPNLIYLNLMENKIIKVNGLIKLYSTNLHEICLVQNCFQNDQIQKFRRIKLKQTSLKQYLKYSSSSQYKDNRWNYLRQDEICGWGWNVLSRIIVDIKNSTILEKNNLSNLNQQQNQYEYYYRPDYPQQVLKRQYKFEYINKTIIQHPDISYKYANQKIIQEVGDLSYARADRRDQDIQSKYDNFKQITQNHKPRLNQISNSFEFHQDLSRFMKQTKEIQQQNNKRRNELWESIVQKREKIMRLIKQRQKDN